MKPTKMRNNQIYRADTRTRSRQLGSNLAKNLRQKYGKRSARIVLGDTVKIVRGEYKGVDGKVAKVNTEKNSVAIEGIKKESTRGEKFDVYIHTSNLMITDLNTGDSERKDKLERTSGGKPIKKPKPKQEPKEKEAPVETPDKPKEKPEKKTKPEKTVKKEPKKEKEE